MSLPIARARRKKVPSIQRSPYSSTSVPLAHGVLEAERGDVARLLELRDLPLVLDQAHLGDDAGEVVVARLVGGDHGRSTESDTPRSTRVLPVPCSTASRSSMWRTSRPSESDISFSDGRRPAHSSPYCRSRKNSSVSREERGRA